MPQGVRVQISPVAPFVCFHFFFQNLFCYNHPMKFIYLMTIFLFLGCSSSYLHNTPNRLTLIHNETVLSKTMPTVDKKYLNLYPLYVDIEIKKEPKNNRYFSFEDARCTDGYEFDYDEHTLLHYILKPEHSTRIARFGNLSFYFITKKDKSFYLLLTQNSYKELQLLYPLTCKDIEKIAVHAEPTKKLSLHCPSKTFQATKAELLPLTHWSESLLIIDTIIKQRGGRRYGR